MALSVACGPDGNTGPKASANGQAFAAPTAASASVTMTGRSPLPPLVVSIAMLMLLAANLRPAVTSVGPLIEQVRQATGISMTAAGALTTLPLVAFGAFAPLAHFGRRFGMERVLIVALALLAIGTLLRSQGTVTALFAGSVCLAAGIAVGNVLVPSIIKRDYPDRVKSVTTTYAIVLGLMPAISTGIAVPLSHMLPGGWRSALAIWALPAIAAVLCLLPAALRTTGDSALERSVTRTSVWTSGLAWQVALFMGLQSLLFYVSVAWFPTFFQALGYGEAEAGFLGAVFQIAGLIATLSMPFLLRRARDQTQLAAVPSFVFAVSLVGLFAFPGGAYLWMVIMGVCAMLCFTVALALITLRAATHEEAASLSLMAQTVGYLLAAAGVFVFGWVHDVSGTWTPALLFAGAMALLQAVVGLSAGRNRTISGEREWRETPR